MFLLTYLMTALSFVAECMEAKDCSLTLARAAYEQTFLTGCNTFLHAFVMVLPIMASLVYADSYEEEKKSGVNKYIATRTDIKKYLSNKAIVVFVMNFACFFVPILFNLFLCKLTFPKIGYDSIYGFPQYALECNYHHEVLLDQLRLESPWIYNLIYALSIGAFAGIFGLITYGVFFLTKKNKLKTIIGIYVVYIIWETVFDVLNCQKLQISSYMRTEHYGSIGIMIGFILILSILGIVLTKIGIRKESLDVGV